MERAKPAGWSHCLYTRETGQVDQSKDQRKTLELVPGHCTWMGVFPANAFIGRPIVDPSNCVPGAGARARGEPNLMESCPCRSFRAVSISRVGRG